MRGLEAAVTAAPGAGALVGTSLRRLYPARKSKVAAQRRGALYNTKADAERAIRRAKRWLANQSTGPTHVPPRHIFKNAEMAAFQFGDEISDEISDEIGSVDEDIV